MKCPECNGYGKVEYADPEVGPCADDIVTCHVCKGTGQIWRKGCRASKNESKCIDYDYGLGRCKRGLVRGTCSKLKPGKNAKEIRDFYNSSF